MRRLAALISLCALGAGSTAAAQPETSAEPPEVSDEARQLGARFRVGRRCVPAALERLRELRAEHGVHGDIGKALALAYRGCDDALAWAELFAEMLGSEGPAEDRLRLGAAWLEAHRPAKALGVLRPLALEQGPKSQAAWLTGYALFQLDAWSEAATWLEGAQETVQGAKRSDAPIMLALVRAYAGEADAALPKLDDALDVMPESAALHAARAYVLAIAGREGDAVAAGHKAQDLAARAESTARSALRLKALGQAYATASTDAEPADADRAFERWLSEASPAQQRKMLEQRAQMLESAGRRREARGARARARALGSD